MSTIDPTFTFDNLDNVNTKYFRVVKKNLAPPQFHLDLHVHDGRRNEVIFLRCGIDKPNVFTVVEARHPQTTKVLLNPDKLYSSQAQADAARESERREQEARVERVTAARMANLSM